MWDWYENTRPPTAEEIASELASLEPGPKHRARFQKWLHLWNHAKTRTVGGLEPELVALQMAAAQELGLSMPFLRREQAMASVQKARSLYDLPMRAFVRALYRATQKHLDERGIAGAILWRGIQQSRGYPFPYRSGFYLGLLANNPLASFTLSLGQAARFAPGSAGALNFAYVESSRIIGTPFTGLGVLPQTEAVSVGAAARAEMSPVAEVVPSDVHTYEEDRCFWLVWHDQDFGDRARALEWQDWSDLIEKYETETGDEES